MNDRPKSIASPRTRLAPSPTGALHLGNARTFLINWALARQQGWQIVLRIDDLDGPRVKADAAQEAIDTLRWLGIDWDEGPLYQTQAIDRYREALQRLARRGDIYRCDCTRTQLQAASLSAPHAGDHELRYPGTCRPASARPFELTEDLLAESAWRVRAPEGPRSFVDQWLGPLTHDVAAEVGDFLVFTKQRVAAYQLAVVCDDAAQQITHIVRGDDLVSSTPRQLWLAELLDMPRDIAYWHVPLVVGTDGRRLAKRHGDSRITQYRRQGVSPQRILALLAEWCGMGSRREMSIDQFLAGFVLESVPREPIVFSTADDRWLLNR